MSLATLLLLLVQGPGRFQVQMLPNLLFPLIPLCASPPCPHQPPLISPTLLHGHIATVPLCLLVDPCLKSLLRLPPTVATCPQAEQGEVGGGAGPCDAGGGSRQSHAGLVCGSPQPRDGPALPLPPGRSRLGSACRCVMATVSVCNRVLCAACRLHSVALYTSLSTLQWPVC